MLRKGCASFFSVTCYVESVAVVKETMADWIVSIAASAGGIQAVRTLLSRLPADFPAAVLIVQHLDPTRISKLAHILGRDTPLPVHQAQADSTIKPGHVYVAPPDFHLVVTKTGRIGLTQSSQVRYSRPSADVMFRSVAEQFGARAIAVVLTGSGSDGAAGALAVREAGGIVIAQDESTSEYFSMPEATIARAAPDYVLPLHEISTQLVSLLKGHMGETETETRGIENLLQMLKHTRGFDFTGYKRMTLMRRVQKRMASVGIKDYDRYTEYLEVHPDEYELLFNTILINVTSFLRDPEAWEALRASVIAPLADWPENRSIRVWSAGCASGQETYTLIMMIAEVIGVDRFKNQVKIYATDADNEALTQARSGTYSAREMENVPEEWRVKYFEASNEGFVFRKDLRRCVIFGEHDLVQDAPISKLDLLICRNTLIYFNAETQGRILARFHFALKDTGFMFLGKSEMLLTQSRDFSIVDVRARIFAKVSGGNLRERLLMRAQSAGTVDPAADNLHDSLRAASFDAAPYAQIVVDRAGVLVLANEPARSMFRLGAHDIGHPVQDLELSFRPVEIRSLIQDAYSSRLERVLQDVEFGTPRDIRYFDVRVTPLLDGAREAIGASVTYMDVTTRHRLAIDLLHSTEEREAAYEELQATNEELETTNEELQSAIEELETTNEELQATNEELETMNAELQSTNQEMETITEELRRRGSELNMLNESLEAIMGSLGRGVAVTDTDMSVTLWNDNAEDMWGVRAAEVEGKSLLALDIGLPLDDLARPMQQYLNGNAEFEPRIVDATNRRGQPIQCRISCVRLTRNQQPARGLIVFMEQWNANSATEAERSN